MSYSQNSPVWVLLVRWRFCIALLQRVTQGLRIPASMTPSTPSTLWSPESPHPHLAKTWGKERAC